MLQNDFLYKYGLRIDKTLSLLKYHLLYYFVTVIFLLPSTLMLLQCLKLTFYVLWYTINSIKASLRGEISIITMIKLSNCRKATSIIIIKIELLGRYIEKNKEYFTTQTMYIKLLHI